MTTWICLQWFVAISWAGVIGPGLSSSAAPTRAPAPTLMVFAASSLTTALTEIGPMYRTASGVRVRYSFAASSTLARQIEAGADADIFLSADEPWMTYLATRHLLVAASHTRFLGNRLVLVVPADRASTVTLTPGFDLAGLLGRGRLATGDPDHVPAGRYAQQALTALGVWSVAAPRLVRADSVRAALVLVERGEVPAGIVYESDAAAAPRVHIAGVFPERTHDPILYPMAILAGHDSPAARGFLAFLRTPPAQAVFTRYQFTLR
jgi:molybdate transport system substrate-binding protein